MFRGLTHVLLRRILLRWRRQGALQPRYEPARLLRLTRATRGVPWQRANATAGMKASAGDDPGLVGGRGHRASGRAHPGARAGPLPGGQAVRGQGVALLARIRAAAFRLHRGADRVPPVALSARRLHPPARRRSERAGARARARARALRAAALAALRHRGGRAALQPHPARRHLLRALRRARDPALADHRHGDRGSARGQGRASARGPRRDGGREDGSLLGGAGGNHRRVAGQDHALRHPARQRRRGARRDRRDRRAPRAAQPERDRRLDRRLAALSASRDRHHRSDLAGGAGGPANLRLHHLGQRRSRSRTGPSSRARSRAPVRPRCASPTCAARTRPCPSCTSRFKSRAPPWSFRSRCSSRPAGGATRPAS